MLTKDLVRKTVRAGKVLPRFLTAKEEDVARSVIDVVAAAEGRPWREMTDALKEVDLTVSDPKVSRGLAKLCMDLLDTEAPTDLDPSAIRAAVFERASRLQPLSSTDRARVLAEVAEENRVSPEAIEQALYADLKEAQLVGPSSGLTPSDLIARYNLALVQAILFDARSLSVRLDSPTPKRLRQLLRWLKFHRLLFTAKRDGTTWTLGIEGPLAVLDRPGQYGLSVAAFLPALVHQERWALEAECRVANRGTATLLLDQGAGLVSAGRDTGVWTAPEERALADRLSTLAVPWTVSTETDVVDLEGQAVLVPDLVLLEPETGRRAFIEVVWRWRRGAFESRWELLRRRGPPNLVLAIAGKSSDQEPLPELPGPVHAFKQLPNAKVLLALCRDVAR